ncbi:MAG: type II toxin-antitoxin system RelE/ParE family toxin [candidate division KSB1 bacterium]|nr:type II toxin-antitoxin system RelE/ParE family toxin [candidate division KSB1 bacterium]
MPETEVLIFAESNGSSPFLVWLDKQPPKVQDKCIVFIERLEEFGHELRRPQADYLRDGIYELRVKRQKTNYRILYFFHENRAIISHGFMKQQEKVPDKEIEIAITNRTKFLANPEQHTYREL